MRIYRWTIGLILGWNWRGILSYRRMICLWRWNCGLIIGILVNRRVRVSWRKLLLLGLIRLKMECLVMWRHIIKLLIFLGWIVRCLVLCLDLSFLSMNLVGRIWRKRRRKGWRWRVCRSWFSWQGVSYRMKFMLSICITQIILKN